MKPPITEPLLLERLAMDEEAFRALVLEAAEHVGRRRATDADVERARGYPWVRPAGSYTLVDGAVQPIALITAGRHPLLAIGSNGAPDRLATKFAHHDTREERTVHVVAGWLHDHDVAPAAFPTAYGSHPATPVPSPGTKVRAAILHVTPLQFTQLTWSEFSYRLVHRQARFDGDEGERHDHVWMYESRWGPVPGVALAAIPAENRTLAPKEQEDLITREEIESIFDDLAAYIRRAGTPAPPGTR